MIVENKVKNLKTIPVEEFLNLEFNSLKSERRDVEKLKTGIKKNGFAFPIYLWKDHDYVIDGKGRKIAVKELLEEGHEFEGIPCVEIEASSLEEAKQRTLEASSRFGDITKESFLAFTEDLNLDLSTIEIDGMDDFLNLEDDPSYDEGESGSLAKDFLIPPFSVFDTKQGYWQDRKRVWTKFFGDSREGRDDNLLTEGLKQLGQMNGGNLSGTSEFDPVLAEISYKWWNIPKGKILDPFAGGVVRGAVAGKLGFNYQGIDLSQKQIDINEEKITKIEVDGVKYIRGNSLNVDTLVEDNDFDLVYSCPPYFDLEVYTDDKEDLSNLSTYEEFIKDYKEIIKKSCAKLKDDRFAVFTVGDIRDKKGAYRGFVADTISAFEEAGLVFYNDIVLLNAIATASLRARKLFNNRKVVKVHQNVLVFYKGDPKKIQENYKTEFNFDEFLKEEDPE
jgi:16S rRNA G966 N2-methylase RsmD